MTLAKSRSAGFTDGTPLTAAECNNWDTQIVKALDGAGGGSYTPSAPINLGGFGLHITSTEYIDVGAYSRLYGTQIVESGGVIRFESGGSETIKSGASSQYQAGSNLYVAGNATVQSGGQLLVASGGSGTIQDGGTVTVAENGILTGRKNRSLYYLGPGLTDPDQDLAIPMGREYVMIAGTISAQRTYTLAVDGGRAPRVGDAIEFALGPTGGSASYSIIISAIVGKGAVWAMPVDTGKTAALRRAAGYAVAVTMTCVSYVESPAYATWMPRWTWY